MYRTNIGWGGGSKEHPGKRRDSRAFSQENNNFRLSREKWNPTDLQRQELLDVAAVKHNPSQPRFKPVNNEAIPMTKVNKEYVERTSATTKYAEKQAYVAGEAEHSQVHKVNDVD